MLKQEFCGGKNKKFYKHMVGQLVGNGLTPTSLVIPVGTLFFMMLGLDGKEN